MPEKGLSEISRTMRELFEKGNTALQRQNLDYALAIFNQILKDEPGFYVCREALRATQFKKAGAGGGFFKKMLGTASNSPMIAKGQIVIRNNPLEAIKIAEEILNSDPKNSMAHKLLADAALAADLPRTAVLSLEILHKNSPQDHDVALRLGEALTAAGQIQKAEAIFADLEQARPNDPNIGQALKNLAARRTMSEGGYDALAGGRGSYRDVLKNKTEAVALEQEQRQVKGTDVAGGLIADAEARLAQTPNDLVLLRKIGALYTEKKDFDRAVEYYNRIIAIEGAVDPSLERLISDLMTRKFEHQLSQLDPSSPNHAEETARIQQERQAFILNAAQKRVERYPTELQLRFELGQLYFEAGRIGEAIQEFQKAQSSPQRRIQALTYLGQCFSKRGLNDVAARTLQNAIKEKTGFDDEKKDLIYALGMVLEKMGKTEEAIEQFKQIYEIDIGYKDVAAKVDAYYAGK